MSQEAVTAFIGLGANLGDAEINVANAMLLMDRLPLTRLTGQSALFLSAPHEADGGDYINAVARIETTLSASDLLRALQGLEDEFGRERPYPNAPRTLDLDLLLYGRQTIATDLLVVPHPRLTERAFVLIPMLQIDPFVEIPGLGPAHGFAPAVAGQVIRKIS